MLTIEQLKQVCPSAFAESKHDNTSDNYRFYPTAKVIEALTDVGFYPTYAKQTRCRDIERRNYTKHILRFRHNKQFIKVGEEVPEIILQNAHDGTSSYQIGMGIFRLVCSNGLAVKSHSISEIKIRHSGDERLIDNVIEGSYHVINEAPKVAAQIDDYKQKLLDLRQQEQLAIKALGLRDSSLEINPIHLLAARRQSEFVNDNGDRDLWTTFNVIQENMIRGGVLGYNSKNKSRRSRPIKAAGADLKLNKGLWELLEQAA